MKYSCAAKDNSKIKVHPSVISIQLTYDGKCGLHNDYDN